MCGVPPFDGPCAGVRAACHGCIGVGGHRSGRRTGGLARVVMPPLLSQRGRFALHARFLPLRTENPNDCPNK